ncbi:MAG: exodeoxyribonuclease VII large subunit [Acutalibacteraceae bacterium]|jgi:exodeoxyribonuclease VII large subunit|nr:exodeoxyribonuclease VII large subunit [Acutalibacteraceae bacterium]
MISANPPILTVTGITQYLKSTMDSDPRLQNIYVTGEISNLTVARSGHMYFSLKDSGATLNAAMFRSYASRLKFQPEAGMKVIVRGSISIYPQTGKYQIIVTDMQPDGVGARAIALEQLKQRLDKEGLFDPTHRKPLPEYPQKIGVVTSPTGAAFQDIKKVLRRRWPVAEITLSPTLVQGEDAPLQIVSALQKIDSAGMDVIILARGGGSMEDLWCFNDERVARAVYSCQTPIVTGVGHETDTTLVDFVADRREPTPSAAAERVSPNMDDEYDHILHNRNRMRSLMQMRINEGRKQVEYLKNTNVLQSFPSLLANHRQRLDTMVAGMDQAVSSRVEDGRNSLSVYAGKLVAFNPLKVLARGYSIATLDSGSIVKSVKDVKTGDGLTVKVSDGTIGCRIADVRKEEE